MPYIKAAYRPNLDKIVDHYVQYINENNLDEGELNYLITQLCLKFTKYGTLNYTKLNSVIGMLECVKQEFYRREVAPYENQKAFDNGDVFTN